MKNALVDAVVPVVAESCKDMLGYIRHEVLADVEGGGATTNVYAFTFRTDRDRHFGN